jgi:hypothetical protein
VSCQDLEALRPHDDSIGGSNATFILIELAAANHIEFLSVEPGRTKSDEEGKKIRKLH